MSQTRAVLRAQSPNVSETRGLAEPRMRADTSPQRAWLNAVYERILAKRAIAEALEDLTAGLLKLRQEHTWAEWREFCVDVALEHPLRELLHQCPFTSHGFSRPRGYAGDAELLDYLYAENACPADLVGSAIYRYIHQLPSAVSVRQRRELLGAQIDAIAEGNPQAKILSVACGHLREVEKSKAMNERRIGELIALDQDAESLALIEKEYQGMGIRVVENSVRALLSGNLTFEGLDFVYSAGLYDYLAPSTAKRLTGILFRMLKPGGRLLVANFAKHPVEVGYIEAFMDWWLIYRSPLEVAQLADEIPVDEIGSSETFHDDTQNVIYLSLTRTSGLPARSR